MVHDLLSHRIDQSAIDQMNQRALVIDNVKYAPRPANDTENLVAASNAKNRIAAVISPKNAAFIKLPAAVNILLMIGPFNTQMKQYTEM